MNACPKSAIKIMGGMYAVVSEVLCIGCGKCKVACPASVVEVQEVKL